MNRHLESAIAETAKADALLFAIDETFMEDAESRQQYLFSALWDTVKRLSEELERLAEDRRVVDVIYAVNDARRKTETQN